MITDRVYNNNYEDTYYPLSEANSGVPNDVITGVSVLCDDDTISVAIHTVHAHNGSVSVTMERESSAYGWEPFAYSSFKTSDAPITSILTMGTDEAIGWISFGSGVYRDVAFAGRAIINPSCLRPISDSRTMLINGNPISIPSILNIDVSGCITYDNDRIQVITALNQNLLDSRNMEDTGAIRYINGVSPTNGRLTITLPRGRFSVHETKSKLPIYGSNVDYVYITISDYVDGDTEYINSQYGCSDDDPIVRKFVQGRANSTDDTGESTIRINTTDETPIDWYIKEYSGNVPSQYIYKIDPTEPDEVLYPDYSSSDSSSSSSESDSIFDITIVTDDGRANKNNVSNNRTYAKDGTTDVYDEKSEYIADGVITIKSMDPKSNIIRQDVVMQKDDTTWE